MNGIFYTNILRRHVIFFGFFFILNMSTKIYKPYITPVTPLSVDIKNLRFRSNHHSVAVDSQEN